MDSRDVSIWIDLAQQHSATRQLQAVEAACAPNMQQGDLDRYLERLREQARGGMDDQEAAWAANRNALKAFFGARDERSGIRRG